MSEVANTERAPGDFARDTFQEQVRQPTLAEAVATVPAEENPFDSACMDMMSRVAAFFGEAASCPTFCGLSVDEMRDEDGKLLSLRLVPCDLVNDEPVRRVGK